MDASSNAPSPTSVLFVCLGNICRSPLAEGVFRHLVEEEGLDDHFEIDSAGTGAWHIGERPDGRATLVAQQHGIELDSRARQVRPEDFERFDYVIAMDRDNLTTLVRMQEAAGTEAHIELLRANDPERDDGDEVPDPYYGGTSGFENVYQMVRRCCKSLLREIRAG